MIDSSGVDLTGAAAQAFAARIRQAATQSLPAPYIFFEEAIPRDLYARVQQAYELASECFQPQIHRGDPKIFYGSYRERLELKVPDELEGLPPAAAATWTELWDLMRSPVVLEAIADKFREGLSRRYPEDAASPGLLARFQPSMLATKHQPNYYLGPHTDRHEKVITLILNCAEGAGLDDLGTAMYEPVQEGFTCRGVVHHDPSLFRKIGVAPFRPNSVLLFLRDDRLFHGVERLTQDTLTGSERRNVQFNLWDR